MSRDRGAEEPEFESGYTGWTSEERDRMECVLAEDDYQKWLQDEPKQIDNTED